MKLARDQDNRTSTGAHQQFSGAIVKLQSLRMTPPPVQLNITFSKNAFGNFFGYNSPRISQDDSELTRSSQQPDLIIAIVKFLSAAMTKWSIISSSKLASKQTQKSSLTTGLKKEQHEHDGRKSGIVSETHGTEELSLHNSSSVHSSPKITKRTNEILTRNSPSGGFSQSYDDDDKNLYDYEGAVANSMQSCLVEGRHALRWEIHDNILNCIGQTPIIKLNRIPGLTKGVNIFVKCENLNPGGSLKDRLAVGIIEWAEKHGKLQPGQTVIEASSGNTGT